MKEVVKQLKSAARIKKNPSIQFRRSQRKETRKPKKLKKPKMTILTSF